MFGQAEIGAGRILHVEKISYQHTVAADFEVLVAKRGFDDAGYQAAEIKITPAEEISAADNRGGKSIGPSIHAGDEVGTALRDFIRETALQGIVLPVGEMGRLAIRFVRGPHNGLRDTTLPGGVEQHPGPPDIRI